MYLVVSKNGGMWQIDWLPAVHEISPLMASMHLQQTHSNDVTREMK